MYVHVYTILYTGGVDYESGPYFVNLTKGDTTAEICIGITDDNILEVIMVDPEIFILRINTITLHPEIIPKPPDSAIVNIRDDECKKYRLPLYFCFDLVCTVMIHALMLVIL